MYEFGLFLIDLGANMIALGVFVALVAVGAWACVQLLDIFTGGK